MCVCVPNKHFWYICVRMMWKLSEHFVYFQIYEKSFQSNIFLLFENNIFVATEKTIKFISPYNKNNNIFHIIVIQTTARERDVSRSRHFHKRHFFIFYFKIWFFAPLSIKAHEYIPLRRDLIPSFLFVLWNSFYSVSCCANNCTTSSTHFPSFHFNEYWVWKRNWRVVPTNVVTDKCFLTLWVRKYLLGLVVDVNCEVLFIYFLTWYSWNNH
jgi:hypothetical protein